ncbi:hypothetical protein ILUMI_18121 [Ignelater luminosus]|uniref:Uncharacterized protein n=1 Tax=Ignelater luminosus TaxID=2038154 RepID=A0A8K0CPR9_IGNLU|nr:hypothetical protein ILUMI_18121 [Ignelater luminosus]
MVLIIGSIEPFHPSESDIISYIECMEQLFQCNKVPKERQVAMFLTLIGRGAYNEVLSNQYCLKKLVIDEKYKFYGAQQDPIEDVKSFAVKLKKLSKFLKDALRDKFVCGLRSENIKRKLLTEENVSSDRAFKIAVSMQLAEGKVRAMGPEVDAVNKLENEKSRKVELQTEGKLVDFEIDSGACKTVMHLLDYKKLFLCLKLYHVGYNLKVVTGENVKIIDGCRHVTRRDVKVVENKSEQQFTSGSKVKLALANSAEQSSNRNMESIKHISCSHVSNKRNQYITEIREKLSAVFSG